MNRKRWILLAAVTSVLLAAIIAFMLLLPRSVSENQSGWERSQETKTPEPTGTMTTTEPAANESSSTESSPSPSGLKEWRSSAPVVYARAGSLWLSTEDGRGKPRRLMSVSPSASYLLSPDRRKLAFTRPSGKVRPLFVLDLASSKTRQIAPNTSALQGFPYAWSPDGARIAYTVPSYKASVRTGESVYTVAADGRGRRLLSRQAGSPMWGPEQHIVFRRTNPARDTWRLMAILSDGSGLEPIPSSEQAGAYGWSPKRPDLAFAALEADSGTGVIKLLHEGETIPQTVLRERLEKVTYTRIAWSPDGRQIALDRSGDDGFSRVRVVDVSGRWPAWETNKTRDTYFAGWSADCSRLLYFEGNSFQGAPSNLWCVRRTGTSRRIIIKDASVL